MKLRFDMKSYIKTIEYDNKTIEYILERKSVKNINLRVKRDGSIAVSANAFVRISTIESFILSHMDFIEKAQKRIEKTPNIDKNQLYADGDIITYLGKKYFLKIELSNVVDVAIKENHIIVKAPKTDSKYINKSLNKWLYKSLEEKIIALCKQYYPIYKKYLTSIPEIRFRKMKSMWGNCMRVKNRLTFSYNLIIMPERFIEYVVVHEFTHFIVPNHSAAFYEALSHVLPDYKQRKALAKIPVN